jgi:DNA-binding protein H-NS
VQIDKGQILDLLRNQGNQQQAQQAEQELPQQVDTDDSQHQNLLQKFGIDPMTLVQKFAGGKGIPGL